MASLLSITTQLLTTAAVGQNWAIYAPSLLKEVMSLFMMARFMAPRKRSSAVNSANRSASKSPGKPTISFLDEEKRGLPSFTAKTPIFAAMLFLPGFDRRHRLIASSSCEWPSFLVAVLVATKRVLAARSRVLFRCRIWSNLDKRVSWRDRICGLGLGRRKLGELTGKISANFCNPACSAVDCSMVIESGCMMVVFESV